MALNTNGLSSSFKGYILAGIRSTPATLSLKERPYVSGVGGVEKWKSTDQANGKQKRTWITILKSDRLQTETTLWWFEYT